MNERANCARTIGTLSRQYHGGRAFTTPTRPLFRYFLRTRSLHTPHRRPIRIDRCRRRLPPLSAACAFPPVAFPSAAFPADGGDTNARASPHYDSVPFRFRIIFIFPLVPRRIHPYIHIHLHLPTVLHDCISIATRNSDAFRLRPPFSPSLFVRPYPRRGLVPDRSINRNYRARTSV